MKKVFLLLVALSLLSFTSNFRNNPSEKLSTINESVECKFGQCYATAKSTGNRCKHCVSNSGDQYCWQHK